MREWATILRDVAHRRPVISGVLTWVIGALWFFRDPIRTGFDTITGDRGDARLVIYLHEHWWRVWQGDADWRSPEMFAPARGTLGYSDTFVLDQVFYAPLRLVGFDQFVAFQLTLVALTAVGFASLFTVMHRHLRIGPLASCLLAATGTFANNVYVDTGHPQLYAVNVVSFVVLLAVSAWHADGRARIVLSSATGALVALLLWSTYYLGWFTVFFGGLVVVLCAVTGGVVHGRHAVRRVVVERWAMGAAAIAGFAVGIVPFFATYLPVIDDAADRSYDEVANLAPRPLDMINVGRDNVVWGWLVRPLLDGDERLDQLNRAVAPTPVLLIVAFVAIVMLAGRARTRGDGAAIVGLAVGIAATIAYVMPIQFGFGGLWAWPHRLIPGASALRVFARVEVVASLLATLTVACWLSTRAVDHTPSGDGDTGTDGGSDATPGRVVDAATVHSQLAASQPDGDGDIPVHRATGPEGGDRTDGGGLDRTLAGTTPATGRRLGTALVVVLAVMCVEQMNTSTRFRQFDRSDELSMLADTPAPPAVCDAFFVTDAGRQATDHTLISAMLIAHEIDVATINGYSGQVPPGWDLRPWNDGYVESAIDWADERDVGRLCSLEITTLRWSTPP